MMLRSIVASLALTHSPLEVQFYVIDCGGGAFSSMDGLEHVSGIAAGNEDEKSVVRLPKSAASSTRANDSSKNSASTAWTRIVAVAPKARSRRIWRRVPRHRRLGRIPRRL